MRKFIILLTLIFSLSVSAVGAVDYKEVYPWAVDSVEYCVENKILQGDEYGNLMLESHITQAQATALIMRSINIKPKVINGFATQYTGHWAYPYIMNFSGYYILPDVFSADSPVTREMYFSMMVSGLGMLPESDRDYMMETFKDCSKLRLEYLPYVTAACKSGLVQGDNNRLYPKENLTRVQAVTVLYRALVMLGIAQPSEKSEEKPPVAVAPVPDNTPVQTPEPEVTYPVIDTNTQFIPSVPATKSTPILGKSVGTMEQAKKWAKSKGAAQRFIDVAQIYWKYGELMGIRPDVLYVQAAKETAFGNYTGRVKPEMNNWAGIKKYGATGDETDDHESFATPDDGVRGHFNHMSAYVGVNPVGETHGRYKSVKSLEWAGTVKTVEALGGKWCPDPQYGVQIVGMLNEMLTY